jgi:O-antigen ligase
MSIALLKYKHRNLSTKILSLGLMGLVLASALLSNLYPFMRYLMWIAGGGLISLYMLFIIKIRNIFAKEILFYCLFVVWATASGIIVAGDEGLFLGYAQLILAIMLLAIAISGFVAYFGYFSSLTRILTIAVLIMDLYFLRTGDLYLIFNTTSQYRATVLVTNPNQFGYYNLLAVYSIILYLGKTTQKRVRILEYGLFALFSLCIIASGSQKAFYGLIILILGWLWFCYGRLIIKRPLYIIAIVIGMAFLFYSVNFVFNHTNIGIRIQNTIIGNDVSTLIREQLYLEGWKIFTTNPIAGIGLSQFPVFSSFDTYSHSDYIELLSTTGIVGFCLYITIYLILFIRLNRLQRKRLDFRSAYEIGSIQAFLLMSIVLSFSRISFLSLEYWFMFSGMIGYTYWIEKKCFP